MIDGRTVTAVLIGTGNYPYHDGLAHIPEVYTNIAKLKHALMRDDLLGVPANQMHVLVDRDRGCLIRELRRAVANASGLLFVYYCGHGALPASAQGLLLTVADSSKHLLDETSLHFDDLKRVIAGSTSAMNRILVLDCCFSGQAILHALPDKESILEAAVRLDDKQTVAIAAAGEYEVAHRGPEMTAFTKAFVDAIEEGVQNRGDELTIEEVFASARSRLKGDSARPRLSKTGSESELYFVRNAALLTTAPSTIMNSLADRARELQRTVFVSAMDRRLDYLKMADSMHEDLAKGGLEDLRFHYLGHRGAKRWLDLASHPAYVHTANISLNAISYAIINLLNAEGSTQISLVSLGCGNGEVDSKLLLILRDNVNHLQRLAYFPIDVSIALLQRAAQAVANRNDLPNVPVLPIAAELDKLANVVAIWRESTNVELYSLLGCTLGNFRHEDRLLQPIVDVMRDEDVLIADARCYAGEAMSEMAVAALLERFNHDRNTEFAVGPISALGYCGTPKLSIRVCRGRREHLSTVEGTRSVVTELPLDNEIRKRLALPAQLKNVTLSWSNVYSECQLERWFASMDLQILFRAPEQIVDGDVETVAFILKKRVATPEGDPTSR